MSKPKDKTPDPLAPFFYKGKTWTVIDGGKSESVLLESETYPHQAVLTKEAYKTELMKHSAEKKNKRVYQNNRYKDFYK